MTTETITQDLPLTASARRERTRRIYEMSARDEAGHAVCQDDYEWATMTGAYEEDRGREWPEQGG